MSKARDLASAPVAPSTVSSTELGYLDGVTSAIQSQVDAKASASSATITSPVIVSPEERWSLNVTSLNTGTHLDILTSAAFYFTTNTDKNFTFNVRGNSSTTLNSLLNVNDSVTVSAIAVNGATAYRCTELAIDGIAQTVKWSGGTAPSAGNASANDAYSFTIIKTASTPAPAYTVLGAGPIKYA